MYQTLGEFLDPLGAGSQATKANLLSPVGVSNQELTGWLEHAVTRVTPGLPRQQDHEKGHECGRRTTVSIARSTNPKVLREDADPSPPTNPRTSMKGMGVGSDTRRSDHAISVTGRSYGEADHYHQPSFMITTGRYSDGSLFACSDGGSEKEAATPSEYVFRARVHCPELTGVAPHATAENVNGVSLSRRPSSGLVQGMEDSHSSPAGT
ncbi:hypothetical protein H4582DRAFT_2059218 [Lactarius indigo]|nr:hypothetical protein H4582DRAFT_2059218 [Lactarius indigo]